MISDQEFTRRMVRTVLTVLVAALTFLSIGFYVAEWVRHMNAAEARR